MAPAFGIFNGILNAPKQRKRSKDMRSNAPYRQLKEPSAERARLNARISTRCLISGTGKKDAVSVA